jgi:hypothetical protein
MRFALNSLIAAAAVVPLAEAALANPKPMAPIAPPVVMAPAPTVTVVAPPSGVGGGGTSYQPPSGGFSGPGGPGGPDFVYGGGSAVGGGNAQKNQQQTIQTQIQADAQKQERERWKIMQDTQTKIFDITQDVTVNQAKNADKAAQAFDDYIRDGNSAKQKSGQSNSNVMNLIK